MRFVYSAPMSSSLPRAVCYRCHKPTITCICSTLPRVDNRTPVLVLQHPRERLHPIGTARFARLGLSNSRVEVAWNAAAREDVPPAWVPEGAALLYPAHNARELRDLPAGEHPKALVVLDGTWSTVRTLYRDKRWLHALPHYRFSPSAPGRYRLRREPQADYVSTIEAIVEALRILEPETAGFAELLSAFDAMIDRQLSFVGTGGPHARIRKRRRPAHERRMPHALTRNFDQLVLVYGESARPSDGKPREFVYFTAIALRSGAEFEALCVPSSGPPDACHLDHMGLTAEDFAAATCGRGAAGADFRTAWAEFLAAHAPAPVLAAWNARTLELLHAQTGQTLPGVVLKGAYRSVFGIDANNLEEIVTRRSLSIAPNRFKGRAAQRIAGAAAVTRLLHARANLENSQAPNLGQAQPHDEVSTPRQGHE